MFVVRRPFRNLGKVLCAGTVITEPATIKRFKGKLAEGKIIEVTEQNFDATAKYFKVKYGVELTASSEPAKTEEAKTEEAKTEEAKTEEAKTEEAKTEEAKTVASVVVKATAK